MKMRKILVVDDKEEGRYLLCALLQGFGYEVETASQGAEALELALEAPPDLIIADILMPVMDGFTLCRHWKKDQRLRPIPFIFYTATYTDERDREFALSLGAEKFIVKPEAPAVFMAVVRETLEQVGSSAPVHIPPGESFLPGPAWPQEREAGSLKQYNEVLIRKLEAKMEQLERARSELERDIAARERVEAERARLATAMEHVAEGIVISDVNWIIQYVNSGLERITGYDRSELSGRHNAVLVKDSEESPGESVLEALGRVGVWSGRMLARKKNGALFHAEVTISSVRDASEAIVNYVSVIRDVTHEVNLEKSLRQAEKMECIGTLAGGIAHDFNNILMAIMGYAEIALALPSENQALKNSLGQIFAAGLRAKELVRQILTFSRRSEQERRPVQLALIVSEAMKLLRASLPSTIEIRREVSRDAAHAVILSDPTQIHQVVMNLGVNAAHAMRDKGGVLSLGLRKVQVEASTMAEHPDLRPGPYVCLEVGDTGRGIDAGILDRIFDPYFTTKEVGEGTGLGLSVAQNIVRASGGTIEVESRPGHGTIFHIWFPGLEEDSAPAVEALERLPSGNERILFVDDEKPLTELGRATLESLGYTVRTELSSPDAFKIFHADPRAFDLVITDMTMPHITGIELAAKIREVRPDIPIILCTGFSEDRVVKDYCKKANCQIVTKPYSIASLAKAVRQALDQR
ncbi:MAG: response regulator [Syntrophobacteraceae bacterium]|nr:response regulator [Syntrophobacteraceae bacterium]